MNRLLKLKKIEPTIFMKEVNGCLQQLVRIVIDNTGSMCKAELLVRVNERLLYSILVSLPEGETLKEIYIEELTKRQELIFILKNGDLVQDDKVIAINPPRHWVAHIVQLSHHDPGYTDLPSLVLKEHDRHLDAAIEIAEETRDFPEAAQFRIVIEQTWSADHYLKNAKPERAEKFIKLLQSGKFELTALFGNMTSEICGHEELYRSLYHAARIKRKYGVPIISAEHNDITGISWGLSRVLTDAGIKIFCPGIPLYYDWGNLGFQSFWDEEAIFGYKGPGAFWWEAPTGKRVLFWCNNQGCGGDVRGDLPGLAVKLQELQEGNYPYSVLRWPVGGGLRDNSPYIADYAETIKAWNEKWAFPRLVCSTNTMFYEDFIKELPEELPVHRGELAGQDYPVASTSTAAATAQNRNNHHSLTAAEKLASVATLATDYVYPTETLFDACEEMLWYDEHAWGYHFPCGPAMKASEVEKSLWAYRASAYTHGVINKALASIADNINKSHAGLSLVVFNPSPYTKKGVVKTPFRELDNSGSTFVKIPPEKDPQGSGFLKGVLLNDRWHANSPLAITEGKFDLVEATTGKKIAFQIIEIGSASDTVQYAGERLGLGSGTQRYGFFETPIGLKRDLCFIEDGIPACGYKTYYLIPKEAASVFGAGIASGDYFIENEFYRVEADKESGEICSIFDKKANRQIVDKNCRFSLGTVVVREKNSVSELKRKITGIRLKTSGPLCATIEIKSEVLGHPAIAQTVSLYAGIKQVFVEYRILKDNTPLLNTHILFPFAAERPVFRYESTLSVMEPIMDYLPGSYSDSVAIQNWVKIKDGNYNILWASLDAPIVELGELWPGYTSPAHRCIVDESIKHPPLKLENLVKGWIGSQIFNNNFGTNFSVSQVGDVLFRYVFTTVEGNINDVAAAKFGWENAIPFEHIFTDRNKGRKLPLADCFVELNNENIVFLNLKEAEDGKGSCLRLWNMSGDEQEVQVRLKYMQIEMAFLTDPTEIEEYQKLQQDKDTFTVRLKGQEMATIKVLQEK